MENSNNFKQIRAIFDDSSIIVYQAYNRKIAMSALKYQTFKSPPYKMNRMTWIKPSFLWMMYRSGWATKPNQEYILAIKITREGFEWALNNSCLSHFDSNIHESHEQWKNKLKNSPVRIQWDPERDIYMNKLNYRSIQIGLSDIAVTKYVNEWILSIEDITPICKKIQLLISENIDEAIKQLPKETIFALI